MAGTAAGRAGCVTPGRRRGRQDRARKGRAATIAAGQDGAASAAQRVTCSTTCRPARVASSRNVHLRLQRAEQEGGDEEGDQAR
jgi:hypothetical protein